jgi:hypothetical protein
MVRILKRTKTQKLTTPHILPKKALKRVLLISNVRKKKNSKRMNKLS